MYSLLLKTSLRQQYFEVLVDVVFQIELKDLYDLFILYESQQSLSIIKYIETLYGDVISLDCLV